MGWDENAKGADETVVLKAVALGGQGIPIVLFHGVTRAWRDWLIVVPALAPFGRLHALDHRGHGESGRGSSYHVRDYVRDAVHFVSSLAEPVIVIGHSLGAMVAAGVAAAIPEQVSALVLEDPTFEMTGGRIDETWFPDTFRAYLPHASSTRPAPEIAQALAKIPVRGPGGMGVVQMSQLRDAASLRFAAVCLKWLDPAVLPVILEKRWLDGYDVAQTLGRIACPTLFLQGDFAVGGALPDDYAAELAGLIRDCMTVKTPGIGHGIHSGAPQEFMRLVAPFLSALAGEI